MGDMTQETRDELLMAVAAIVLGYVPVPGHQDVYQTAVPMTDKDRVAACDLLTRANRERNAPEPPEEDPRDAHWRRNPPGRVKIVPL